MHTSLFSILALLHPQQAPHLHPEEPSHALWVAVAVGLAAAVGLFVATRRGSRNSTR